MAQVEKPKPKINDWPPKKYKSAHKVGSLDNWWNLAKSYGRSDPWDIIKFNFLTDNPLYVNYYLHKYVGCTKETTDHQNYRFSDADSPGMIYIPPDDWAPPGPLDASSEAARRAVLGVLADSRLGSVSFVYQGYPISWSLFIAVANRIIDRRITVKYDENQGSQAEYDPDDNTLFIGFKDASALTQSSLIVHEATHAGLDILKAGNLIVREAEAAAYIAQASYFLAVAPERHINDDSDTKNQTWQQQIFDMAFQIAKGLKAGGNLGTFSLEVSALENAVKHEPKYSSHYWKKSRYTGV